MTKILFICHGNICRSPMAEFVLRYLAQEQGLDTEFSAASAATSAEELGNPVHYGTLRQLASCGIPVTPHRSVQVTKADYAAYDYLIAMDANNIRNLLRITGGDPDGKIRRLLDFTDRPGDIADPWYTGDYEATYRDVRLGCEGILTRLSQN